MRTDLTRNPVGQLVAMNDTRGGVAWFTPAGTTESVRSSVHGQWWTHQGPGGQSQTFTYDAAGRLSKAVDPTGSGCQVRVYGFDADSNRTSLSRYDDATSGCQTATVSGSVSSSFDAADRLLPAGGAGTPHYDSFGRIDSIGDGLVTGTGALSVGYYANDVVQSQGQNGSIMCWALDAQQRRSTYITYSGTGCAGTPAAQKVNHYSDASSDSPDWIAETADGNSWTAYVSDLIGNLAVSVAGTSTSTAATYEYANLHGDVIGTADAGAPSPTLTVLTDEFGNTLYGGTAAGRYGWLGGKQRSQEDLAGLTLMGARLYNPTLGRFLSVDPVPGGSANDYDHSNQDPVNSFDLDGRCVEDACIGEGMAPRWLAGAAAGAVGLTSHRRHVHLPHFGWCQPRELRCGHGS